MAKNILIIGGTGPSGPDLTQTLLGQGHQVAILHRGVHEPEGLPDVPHIHADPHFAETLEDAVKGHDFDVVISMYGRLAVQAEVFSGRCAQFIAVGGRPIYPGYMAPKAVFPHGMRINTSEFSGGPHSRALGNPSLHNFTRKMTMAEDAVMRAHAMGRYNATIFRFPYVYGPRAVLPLEWSFIRRIRDGRLRIPLVHGGANIFTRVAAVNAAHAMALAVGNPVAAGQVFNIGDDAQFSYAQWLQLIARAMGRDVAVVTVPETLSWVAGHVLPFQGTATQHAITDTAKIRNMLGYRDRKRPQDVLEEMIAALLARPPAPDLPGWSDPFDYALEDRVMAAMDDLAASFAPPPDWPAPIHVYAHPKAPNTGPDHKGR